MSRVQPHSLRSGAGAAEPGLQREKISGGTEQINTSFRRLGLPKEPSLQRLCSHLFTTFHLSTAYSLSIQHLPITIQT